MTRYAQHFSKRITPQNEAIPGSTQVKNSAGGYSFQVDKWAQLDRFLILGAEGGTYYVKERKLTKDNANSILECLREDGLRTVQRIIDVSEAGKAPKNDAAIFALAVCAASRSLETRKFALGNLHRVCRIGTHMFQFMESLKHLRGRGRLVKQALLRYLNQPVNKLAYQMVKYQQRNGWSQRDILRLAKPKPTDKHYDALYGWAVGAEADWDALPAVVRGFAIAKQATSNDQIVKTIREYNLPREAIPTQWLKDPKVLEALFENQPMTAMIRNLANMARAGLHKPNSFVVRETVRRVTEKDILHKARVHPMHILYALRTYAQGGGFRSTGNPWDVNQDIVDALDEAFYLSFDNVEPTGQRWLLGVDVSGSMTWGASDAPVNCLEAACAMAMVTYRTEPTCFVHAFATTFQEFNVGRRSRLDSVISKAKHFSFGGTDCALPMVHALQNRIEVDTFAVYTDSETWAGKIHPVQALQRYRDKMGIPAKLVVVGMEANPFTIADPNDAGMLDVVGFDPSVPNVISQFSAS